jgi:DeoR/GlpR family transcriptional regulator of sugar metabolism
MRRRTVPQAQDGDLITLVRDARGRLTPKMQAIADLALSDTEGFIRNTSRGICARLGTSEPTLIRFCREFGYPGLSDFRIDLALSLARQPRDQGFVEPLAQDRRRVNLAAKRAIAERAVPLIEGDNAILIDNGSTAEFFAEGLGSATPLTILTNGLVVAQNALAHGIHEVMLTGGRIRPDSLSLTGRLVSTGLKGMRFDTFIMGADSLDPTLGLSTFREDEAQVTEAMLQTANRVIVLADRTKFSKPSLHKICGFDRVSILVTDLPEDTPALSAIRARGVEIIVAGAPDNGATSEEGRKIA